MKYKWEIIPVGDKEKVLDLALELKVLPVLANMFIARGIETREDAEKFFFPDLKNQHEPSLLQDIDKARDRVLRAMESREKIMIWGDYDVDGTTGTALLYKLLKPYFPEITYYIPDRYNEGYGISYQGIDYALSSDVGLIISVDTGIKNIDEIAYARVRGIDFIVLDHHTPGEQLPPAIAVIDPKREDDNYPFKELTGCGVAFKFLQYMSADLNLSERDLYRSLDLLVLSIGADIVPIVDENRIYAYFGLKLLNKEPSIGIRALKEVAGWKDRSLTVGGLVFTLAPRINAAGRIGHGSQAVELLVSDNYDQALQIAREIDTLNRQRQQIQSDIVKEILEGFEKNPELKDKNSTVLYNPHWHKGVVGIAASKVIEYVYKPTIILTSSEDGITGSARSVADFDLYEAIEHCAHLLTKFGGHKYAAGLSLKRENLEKFIECFERVVTERITDDMKKPRLKISGVLRLKDINAQLVRVLKKMEPYGPGNPKPVFVTMNVKEASYRVIGRDSSHLLLSFKRDNGNYISAISFESAEKLQQIVESKKYDIAYTVGESDYNGSIQLEIKDFRFRE